MKQKLNIQNKVKSGAFDLIWLYILEFENHNNPLIKRKIEIAKWKELVGEYVEDDIMIKK